MIQLAHSTVRQTTTRSPGEWSGGLEASQSPDGPSELPSLFFSVFTNIPV